VHGPSVLVHAHFPLRHERRSQQSVFTVQEPPSLAQATHDPKRQWPQWQQSPSVVHVAYGSQNTQRPPLQSRLLQQSSAVAQAEPNPAQPGRHSLPTHVSPEQHGTLVQSPAAGAQPLAHEPDWKGELPGKEQKSDVQQSLVPLQTSPAFRHRGFPQVPSAHPPEQH
jgi:hypothetical protein